MPTLNLNTVNESKNEKNFILSENFLNDKETINISWKKTIDIFRTAGDCNAVNFYSFATGSIDIDKVQKFSLKPHVQKIIEKIQLIHPGNIIASSLSISFIGKNNNKIDNDDELELKKMFESQNPFKSPKTLPDFAKMKTPKFFYSVDTFFVQINGTSYWKIDTPFPEEFTLKPGDVVFIPKQLVHTAEYLSPGSMLSLSFSD